MHKTQTLLIGSLLFLLINLLIFAANITSRLPNALILLQNIYTVTLAEIDSQIQKIKAIQTSLQKQTQLYKENLELKRELYDLTNRLNESSCLRKDSTSLAKRLPIKLKAINYPTEGELLFSLPDDTARQYNALVNSPEGRSDIFVVTTNNMLVGKVKTIKNKWIFVETIYKIGFETPVLLTKAKVTGLYKRLSGGLFIMDIPTEYNVEYNEPVELLATNIPPTPILVGRIKEIKQEHAQTIYLIKIEPAWQYLQWNEYDYLLILPNTVN